MMRRLYIISIWFALAVLITSCEWLPEVGSVKLSESVVTLTTGETKTITATVEPSGAEYESIKWSSSDPTVASVRDGLIRAGKIGVARITASAEGVTSLPCEVTVMSIPVTGVQLDRTMATINEGESLTLSATIWPGNATDKMITWSSSDEKIATVSSSGKVTAITEGVATIFAQAKDGGAVASCKVTVTSEEVNFPDANFRKYMLDNFDLNKNGKISLSEAKKVTSIKVSTVDIESVQGIEYLENLTSLDLSNPTGGAGFGRNSDGTIWYECHNPSGKLKSLDISNNKKLTYLFCSYNQLSSLEVSNNTALESLDCGYNQLTTLNASNNRALNYLVCEGNQMVELDITKNTKLIALRCSYNRLTSLDTSENSSLTRILCHFNLLTSLDLSKNTALSYLSCTQNLLIELNTKNNSRIVQLYCDLNQLSSLDVTNNTLLTNLGCSNNQITSLNISKNTALISLSCSSNQLSSINVSQNSALTNLSCGWNHLTTLDVSKNTALQSLNCGNNKITTLDVSKNTTLTQLSCYGNQITALDVSKNTALQSLNCYSNQLTALDVSKNTSLTNLYCYYNKLTSLDVSKNQNLQYLDCNPMNNNSLRYLYMAPGQTISKTFDVPSYTTIIRK